MTGQQSLILAFDSRLFYWQGGLGIWTITLQEKWEISGENRFESHCLDGFFILYQKFLEERSFVLTLLELFWQSNKILHIYLATCCLIRQISLKKMFFFWAPFFIVTWECLHFFHFAQIVIFPENTVSFSF